MVKVDSEGRTIWITDAHRDDGKRYVVHADEKLTAFLGSAGLYPRKVFGNCTGYLACAFRLAR
jgi:hypothetical protein